MITICSYCRTLISRDAVSDGRTSHGICPRCYVIEMSELDKILKEKENEKADKEKDKGTDRGSGGI